MEVALRRRTGRENELFLPDCAAPCRGSMPQWWRKDPFVVGNMDAGDIKFLFLLLLSPMPKHRCELGHVMEEVP